MSLSVIICSKNAANLLACVATLRRAEREVQVIVVDDGLDLSVLDGRVNDHCWECDQRVLRLDGIKPFVFARNVNLAIRHCAPDDVFLLNDDALVETPGGITQLAREAREHGFGILSAVTNVTGYANQFGRSERTAGQTAFCASPVVAFCCVLIPRSTIDRVGLLDERFACYGGEDVDYCRRVRDAGLDVIVSRSCFVDHSQLASTFRPWRPGNLGPGDCAEGYRLLAEKWGNRSLCA